MILAVHRRFEQGSPAARRPDFHSSSMATARMGLPVPPLIFNGNPIVASRQPGSIGSSDHGVLV